MLHKYEDQDLNPQDSYKKPGMVAYVYEPIIGEQRQEDGRSLLASLAEMAAF